MADDPNRSDASNVIGAERQPEGPAPPAQGGTSQPVSGGHAESTSRKKKKKKKKRVAHAAGAGGEVKENAGDDDAEGDEVEEQILVESEAPSRDELGDVSMAVGPSAGTEEEVAPSMTLTAEEATPQVEESEEKGSTEPTPAVAETGVESTHAPVEHSEETLSVSSEDPEPTVLVDADTISLSNPPPKLDDLFAGSDPAEDVFASLSGETEAGQESSPPDSEVSKQLETTTGGSGGNLEAIFAEEVDGGDVVSQLSQPEGPSTRQEEASSEPTPPQTTRLDALFAGDDDSADVFAQISSERPEKSAQLTETPVEGEQAVTAQSSEPPKMESLLQGGEDGDVFAQLGATTESELAEAQVDAAGSSLPNRDTAPVRLDALFGDDAGGGDVFAQIGRDEGVTGDELEPNPPAPQAVPALDDKDFSDLLAEFEGELDGQETSTAVAAAPEVTSTAALLEDDSGPSAFDDILASSSTPQVEIPASESALAATEAAYAEQVPHPSSLLKEKGLEKTDDSGALLFDVPQGWYNDAGEWQWYTEEEKELVRLTMMDEAGLDKPAVTQSQLLSSTQSYFPQPVSENAARRTPQPENAPQIPQNTYDPYAPPATQTVSSYLYTPTTTTSYVPTSSPYSAQPSQPISQLPSPYAPSTAASYDRYAPSTSTSTSTSSAYAPPQKPYGTISAPSSASRAPPVQEDRPFPPKRVVSNAYDPPFLRPQKSFVRPASAMATTPLGFTAAPPAAVTPPQPAPPVPPPSGPPRRTKTPIAAATPAYAPPPPKLPTPSFVPSPPPPPPVEAPPQRSNLSAPDSYAPADPYARRTSQPAVSVAAASVPPTAPAAQSQSRPSPHNQSYNSFDPPLRPTSAGRARAAASAAPLERISSPPIASLAPPPAPPPAGPPRGPSRGSMRKPSPMFEDRPLGDRPPSRAAGIGSVHGRTTLALESDLPPRPVSRPPREVEDAPRPAVQGPSIVRNVGGEGEGYDTEGGDLEDRKVSSPDPIRSEPNDFRQQGLPQPPNAHDATAHPVPEEAPRRTLDASLSAAHRQPQGEQRYDPYTPPSQGAYDSGKSEASRPDPVQKPPQQQSAFSTYDPAPYQTSSEPAYAPPPLPRQSAATAYQPSAPSQPYPSYQPPLPAGSDSLGLGLQTMGSPARSKPKDIYSPYAPSVIQPETSYAPYGPGAEQQTSLSAPYAPAGHSAYQPAEDRASDRAQPSGAYDPYGPSSQPKMLSPSRGSQPPLGSSYGSDLGSSPTRPGYFQAMPPPDPTYVPQQVLEQKPVSEDPLGRSTLAARNAPLAVFGFGGVLITAFPGSAEQDGSLGHARKPSYGYASGRGQLWIRTVSDLASSSALKPNDNVFPGPLVYDPATPRGAAGDKKKREAVVAYLTARAEEMEKGLPYLKTAASRARREEEGKLVLVKLLAALVSGEGKLSGKSDIEEAVRNALCNSPSANGASAFGSSHLSPMKAQTGLSADSTSSRANASNLKELADLLARGEKREAAQYAAKRGLWSHALLISSSADPELWSEIVMRFTEAELARQADAAALKAAYAVFSGRVATSVDDLINAANLSGESTKDHWREVIAALVFNGKPADLACLDELGSRLRTAGFNYPAHVCHLLSPTSAFGDITPGVFDRTIPLTQNARDEDAIIFAEIAEYARSLISLPKGQELPFIGLPQLLPYKLQRAWLAAELGDVEQAKRYCTAIEMAAKPGKNAPTVLPRALLASLEDLHERLTGTPSINPAGSLGSGRKAKGGAGIGSWLEGRLTKFIAGEEGETPGTKPPAATSTKDTKSDAPIGPFSHFSTIAPAASEGISRMPSMADLGAAGAPDFRRPSPLSSQSHWQGEHPYDQSGQGDKQGAAHGSAWSPWSGNQVSAPEDAAPSASVADDEGEFINPMAALSMGPRGSAPSDYKPPTGGARNDLEEEEDDLGFGNSSLSRGRTPKPAAVERAAPAKEDSTPKKEDQAQPAAKSETPKGEQKGSWLGRWWTKKEGEGGGPIRAKLGEESSMVYDKDLKRWVVKGAQPEPVAAPPPPPPRAQTVSPAAAARPQASARAMSATPPPPQFNAPPSAPGPRGNAPPAGFSEIDGQIRRNKSMLSESITADAPAPLSSIAPPTGLSAAGSPATGPPGPPGPSGPPGGPPKPASRPATASIDDLLSRPPSKRPGSSARKPMKNRYVDVFQPGGES